MGKIEGSVGRGAASASFDYDFAVEGGAVGAITLRGESGKLPDNACIVGAWIEAITTPTSGGAATIRLGYTGNDNALLADTAFNHASYTAGNVTAATAELPLKLDAANGVNLIATVATAALTAGRFRVHVQYIPGA